jgi:hypothetical protein
MYPTSSSTTMTRSGSSRYTETVRRDGISPLLVVADVVVGSRGFVLLPAIPREGLYLGAGDTVDVVHEESREEVTVLGLEPDRDPSLVRLRVSSSVPLAAGFEVWLSQGQSHVVLKRPPGIGAQRRSRSG